MQPSPISVKPISLVPTSPGSIVDWNAYHFTKSLLPSPALQGMMEIQLLKGTQLSCTLNTKAAQWECRQSYIEQVVTDVLNHCPKDEPLSLISLGSDRLLMEYIIGKTLIKMGYSQLSFFLVDPAYKFSEKSDLDALQKVRDNFRDKMVSIHSSHFDKDERIKYLSRAQNISNYFTHQSNVLMLECLPPYAEPLKFMKERKVPEKSVDDLLAGSHLLKSSEQANAITLIPLQYQQIMSATGANFKGSLGIPIFGQQQKFAVDWGCKIGLNGNYRISFSGQEYMSEKESVPNMKKDIEQSLNAKIAEIRNGNANQQLTGKMQKELLETVERIASSHIPGICSYFSVDYALDRKEAMVYLNLNASHHYRKSFILQASTEKNFEILEHTIQ